MSFPDTSAPIGLCLGMRTGERNTLKNIRKTLGMMAVTGAIVALIGLNLAPSAEVNFMKSPVTALVTVVVIRNGKAKWAWIPGIPLAWDLLVTMVASYQKIFSSDAKIGYWAQHNAFVDAKNKGLTKFKTAKTPEEIDAVIRNTLIQETLSVLFAVLVIVVVIAGVFAALKALRAGHVDPEVRDDAVPSQIFAPSGMRVTPDEESVLAQWREAGLDPEGVHAGERVHA